MSRPTRTTMLPLALLLYLAVVAWLSRGRLASGDYALYFGVIGLSLVIIVALWLVLRRRDALRRKWDDEQYGHYTDGNTHNS